MNPIYIAQLAKACAEEHYRFPSYNSPLGLEGRIRNAIERAIEPLQQELEQERNWKEEDPRMLREQLRISDSAFQQLHSELAELRKSFELQRRNYVELYESVLGAGCTTSDVKDINAIAIELRKDRDRLEWFDRGGRAIKFKDGWVCVESDNKGTLTEKSSGNKTIRDAIDAAMKGNE